MPAGGRRRVVQPGHHDQGHHPVQARPGRVAERDRLGVAQRDLGRGHRAGAELVLEPVQHRTRRASVGVRGTRNGARLRLPAPAPSGRASATAIAESIAEQNHFSPVSRQVPPPCAPRVVVPGDVRPALRLGHPLAAGDGRVRVGRDQPGQPGVADLRVDLGAGQQRRGPVGHRDRAGERGRLRPVQVQQGVLEYPGPRAPALPRAGQVRQRDDGVPRRGGPQRLPAGRRLDPVDPPAPAVVADEPSAGSPRRRGAPRAAGRGRRRRARPAGPWRRRARPARAAGRASR